MGKIVLKTQRTIIESLEKDELKKMWICKDYKKYSGEFRAIEERVAEHGDDIEWYTGWLVKSRKEPEKTLGCMAFNGTKVNGAVYLNVYIPYEHEKNEIASEAVEKLCGWALKQKNVFAVEASADYNNDELQEILKNAKMKRFNKYKDEASAGDQLWYITKKDSPGWNAVYMCAGTLLGMGIGEVAGGKSLGIVIGLAIGLIVGTIFDKKEQRRRERILAGEETPQLPEAK